jgi:hypothetical protein
MYAINKEVRLIDEGSNKISVVCLLSDSGHGSFSCME